MYIDINDVVRISIGKTLLMTGYISKVSYIPSTASFTMTGRSKSQDIVDSRISHQAVQTNLAEISEVIFAKFNQKFSTKIETKAKFDFAINAQSAFQSLNQLAKQQNLIFIEQPTGDIQLRKIGDVDNSDISISEDDLSKLKIKQDFSSKFGITKVKTNLSSDNLSPAGADGKADKSPFAMQQDNNVRAVRVQEFIADSLRTTEACENRVAEIIDVNEAQSLKAKGDAPEFTNNDGQVWALNEIYTIEGVKMLLASVNFVQTGNDRKSTLSFKGYNHV